MVSSMSNLLPEEGQSKLHHIRHSSDMVLRVTVTVSRDLEDLLVELRTRANTPSSIPFSVIGPEEGGEGYKLCLMWIFALAFLWHSGTQRRVVHDIHRIVCRSTKKLVPKEQMP